MDPEKLDQEAADPGRPEVVLAWGARWAVPRFARAAWGARWIFPDDLVSDRQSFHGYDTEAGKQLDHWLCGGAINSARARAVLLSRVGKISTISEETVVLWEDEVGKIVGSPNGSHGYMYVAAWLREDEDSVGSHCG